MKRIACLSQKGGVGKSSISRHLAASFAEAEWDTVLVDMDTRQNTSTGWAKRRQNHGFKPIDVVQAPTLNSAKVRPEADIAIIDGKPYSNAETYELAKPCDLIIIPAASSLDDLEPQVVLANDLTSRGINRDKILFVIYGFLTSGQTGGKEVEEVREYIGRHNYQVAKTAIGSRRSYITALNNGLSLSEVDHPSSRRAGEQLATEIYERIAKD